MTPITRAPARRITSLVSLFVPTKVRVPAPRAPVEQRATGDGGLAAMLAILHAVLDEVAWLEPDGLYSEEPAGRELVTLAGAARAAVAVVGGESGAVLRQGPGVVVVRDLVEAVTLLERVRTAPINDDDRVLLAGLTSRIAEAMDRFRACAPPTAPS